MSMVFACAMAVAVDGDTLRCANIEDANGRVRLARIDAPEMDEQDGEAAKQALAAIGRVVAQCFIGDVDLQAALIESKQAEVWP